MITKILRLIQSALLNLHPQHLFKPQFAKQEEFCFVQKIPPYPP